VDPNGQTILVVDARRGNRIENKDLPGTSKNRSKDNAKDNVDDAGAESQAGRHEQMEKAAVRCRVNKP
jgi:hypothetical protein